jgi:hypothetical protein
MFTATNARIASIDSVVVETELALININIINAVDNNQTSVQINGNTHTMIGANTVVGTPMTLDANYYSSWQTITANNLAAGQMASVIDNFQKLGYTVSRASSDAQHIYWNISW